MLPDNLYCPTLHTEIFITVKESGPQTAGNLAIKLLNKYGFERSDVSTTDYENLRDRIKLAARRMNLVKAEKKLIDKNNHTIIQICSET